MNNINVVSVFENSNRIISSSEDSWQSIRKGSFIKFGNDDIHYQLASIKPLNIIKRFKTTGVNEIFINSLELTNLMEGDNIKIECSKYELLTVEKPIKNGKGYKVGDLISLEGGELYKDPKTGLNQPTLLEVTEINKDGGINQIRLVNKGIYFTPPKEECNIKSGGGSGAKFKIFFEESPEKIAFEYCITKIEQKNDGLIITVNGKINEGIGQGNVSVNKWEGFLTEDYKEATKLSVNYSLCKDFTPNLRLPLTSKITGNPYAVYNLSVKIIDREFGKLRSELDSLKKQLNK